MFIFDKVPFYFLNSKKLKPIKNPEIKLPKWPKKSTLGNIEIINIYKTVKIIFRFAIWVFPLYFPFK